MYEIETRHVNGAARFVVRQIRTESGRFVSRYVGTADSMYRAKLLVARDKVSRRAA